MTDHEKLENGESVIATVIECEPVEDGFTSITVKVEEEYYADLEHNTMVRKGTPLPVKLRNKRDPRTVMLI